jgi:hypothetical protein
MKQSGEKEEYLMEEKCQMCMHAVSKTALSEIEHLLIMSKYALSRQCFTGHLLQGRKKGVSMS